MHKNFKLGDVIITVLLIVCSFIPYAFLKQNNQPLKQKTVAIVKVNNHKIKELNLDQNTTWTYDKDGHKNILQVKNKKIHMVEANCKDQVCVKEGWKNKPGQTIICLPHKFLVEIKQTGKNNQTNQNFDHTLVNP